jgi:hypothetical protein
MTGNFPLDRISRFTKLAQRRSRCASFFILVFAFVLSGCNSAKDIGGMYHMISDDPALQRITLEIDGTRVSGQGTCNRYF